MTRRLHPNKDIEAALSYAECQGWQVRRVVDNCSQQGFPPTIRH